MNISIISMQRVCNYGSFLQAYALKRIFEESGHIVQFSDIEKVDTLVSNKDGAVKKIFDKARLIDKYIFKRIAFSIKNREMNEMFHREQNQILGLSSRLCAAVNGDIAVIGSDEVFNCEKNSAWGVSGQRFGDIPGAEVVFSYAASCGYTGVDDLTKETENLIRNSLRHMKGISVRDKNTQTFIEQITGKKPEVHLDPVLIYDFKKEFDMGMEQGVPSKPYMLVYAYHNRINEKNEINAIMRYAKRNGLKTICVGGSLPWCDEFHVISPFQVLAYFNNAECVVTDTFHGTIIASKYKKRLAVLVRKSNENKLNDLLERMMICGAKVTDIRCIDSVLDQKLDYSNYEHIVENSKNRTYVYLNEMLS